MNCDPEKSFFLLFFFYSIDAKQDNANFAWISYFWVKDILPIWLSRIFTLFCGSFSYFQTVVDHNICESCQCDNDNWQYVCCNGNVTECIAYVAIDILLI